MSVLVYMIPIALLLGLTGLCAFLWALRSGQFDDLDGVAERILFDDEDVRAARSAVPAFLQARLTHGAELGRVIITFKG